MITPALPARTTTQRRSLRRERLALDVLRQFRLIYGSVRQQFRDIEVTCDLSGSQLWMLHEIRAAPGIGVSELAQRLSIHQTTCSQHAERLFARGFVVKARLVSDQRRVGLTATRAAIQLLAKAPGPAEGLLPAALAALPENALGSLNLRLDELIAKLRTRDERASDQPLADL